jgi:hypothetical protein
MSVRTRIAAGSAATLTALALVASAGLTAVGAAPATTATWLNGDRAPAQSITLLDTTPVAVAYDAAGLMYISNYAEGGRQAISVYPSSWTTGTEPIKVLEGEATQLSQPVSIAFDSKGRMYVANVGAPGAAGMTSITVYAANWQGGDTAPIKVLKGESTGLVQPFDIAFDAKDQMYVTNLVATQANPGRIAAYAANWASGDTAPIKVLEGAKSKLDYPTGLAFDKSGAMYVVNIGIQGAKPSVAQFRANWKATDAPAKVLTGANTRLEYPTRVAFDSAGRMYVTNGGLYGTGPRITGYAPKWKSGNTRPISTLAGANSLLTRPFDLAFDKAGRLAVTNAELTGQRSVFLFSPAVSVTITGKRTKPTQITLTGRTTGLAKGTKVTAYVRPVGTAGAFEAQKPVKISKGDISAGSFTYRLSGVKAKVSYEVYVVAGGVQSKTITVRR